MAAASSSPWLATPIAASNPFRDRLNWQATVNTILRAAEYDSGSRAATLRLADFNRLDTAFAAGETPEQFAFAILERDGYR